MTIFTETIVRAANHSDLQALYLVIRSIYESTEMMCEQFIEKYPGLEELEAEFDDLLSTNGSLFLLSEDSSGLNGYITVKPLKQSKLTHTAYINMGVAARTRGRSVGRLLLSEALNAIAKKKVVEILYLTVREDNNAAVRLYESFNFETIARLERDTKIGDEYFTGLLMRLFASKDTLPRFVSDRMQAVMGSQVGAAVGNLL